MLKNFIAFCMRNKKIQPKTSAERVKQWIDWAENHPENSPSLSDEALRRDSIYDC